MEESYVYSLFYFTTSITLLVTSLTRLMNRDETSFILSFYIFTAISLVIGIFQDVIYFKEFIILLLTLITLNVLIPFNLILKYNGMSNRFNLILFTLTRLDNSPPIILRSLTDGGSIRGSQFYINNVYDYFTMRELREVPIHGSFVVISFYILSLLILSTRLL